METETTVGRRSSCFDYEHKKTISHKFPEDDNVLVYPSEYVQKLDDEIEQWKNHVKEGALDKRIEFLKRKRELKSTIYDETVLSKEQQDFLESVGFNKYLQRAEEFCDRLTLSAEIHNYHQEDEWQALTKSTSIRKKIKSEICGEHFK